MAIENGHKKRQRRAEWKLFGLDENHSANKFRSISIVSLLQFQLVGFIFPSSRFNLASVWLFLLLLLALRLFSFYLAMNSERAKITVHANGKKGKVKKKRAALSENRCWAQNRI